jgi:uncharacterized protein
MIIDGHAHACGDFLTPEKINQTLLKNGVDKVVLVPGEFDSKKTYPFPNVAKYFPNRNVTKFFNQLTRFVFTITNAKKDLKKGNVFVHSLVKLLPEKIIQFYLLTDDDIDISNVLTSKHKEQGFKGLKIHHCWVPILIDTDLFAKIADWATENEMPIFIHLLSDKEVYKLIEYKKIHPKLRLIVAHLFGLEIFIKLDFKDTNLYFDISTFQVTSDKRVLKAIDFVGASKIIMGSDTPYGKGNLRNNIDRIKNLDISTEEKDLILGENIRKLLNI